MIFKEDTTFDDLRDRSVSQWLSDMEKHEDLSVRGGVKVTLEYIADLKKKIAALEDKVSVREKYLKQMKDEKTGCK